MIEIIPAIDLIDGKCVRLSQGDYEAKKVYNEDPLEVAKMFEGAGIRRLHLVDLDGAKAKHIVNQSVLEKIASNTSLIIDFGGGVQSDEDIEIAFNSGASMVTGGSIAIRNKELFTSWITKYGADKIILGADCKDHKIAVSGWQEATSVEVIPFIGDYNQKGISKVVCTDISKDGMLQGPSIDLYKDILNVFPNLYLIASGGVSCFQDILDLEKSGVPAVILGKAIYENRVTLKELSRR
ncbi:MULTISPECIES: 1-(5-phosphoribosyl)-5-[(5-phosphoribosylamino)methylideneamino]imidazole-4-carboxamide isomerase [Dysgonomonas]|uniref:1-(5-phosphoribosyl)-5-[(5- phosphoribosylamino)methylideneamino]imidazole-4- carboxamide isomerase n=1 Tax=Dysgonomonas TaxID=156973 RepID=UPI0009291AD7|nr:MULTISPECIES: 1-(5-phosphoribosyl)-5-[(5-phosphoribosylamino)methylideneamino]imidazole-4-carboxamide isomerase [Dysgonomonas]MBN9301880.1 1-(5-phosphoribosyl)-5-[(5-phosphoribosylamino)methylideneamino]imidazole-4-carboxamide isomerase [Dysgonomonas mossii]OJX58452.1 MAG: 1-(5-phosphoribosyl)-5-[(5-phosphoribosylamino)methylideneamino]imidazole-4-carboxamide isomerase [Dysgonomonas sp. 37-18]